MQIQLLFIMACQMIGRLLTTGPLQKSCSWAICFACGTWKRAELLVVPAGIGTDRICTNLALSYLAC